MWNRKEKKDWKEVKRSQRTLGQCETHQHPYYRGVIRRREEETEKIFQAIIAKNFPNMGKEPLTQVQEVQRVPYNINPRGNTPRHILIKLTKIKDKEKILKAARGNKQITYKGTPIRLLADFSAETLQARREWHDILKRDERKKPPTKITLPSKALIQI